MSLLADLECRAGTRVLDHARRVEVGQPGDLHRAGQRSREIAQCVDTVDVKNDEEESETDVPEGLRTEIRARSRRVSAFSLPPVIRTYIKGCLQTNQRG